MRIIRKFLANCTLLLSILHIVFQTGCTTAPIRAEAEEPTTARTEETASPKELIFNGISYPVDSAALTVGPYGLEQLQWTTALTELEYIGEAPASWDFLAGLSSLTCLRIRLSAGTKTDLRLDDYMMPSLKTLEIDADCPIGTMTLPKAVLTDCALRLSSVTSLDVSSVELDALFLSLPTAPEVLALGGVAELTCDGFSLDAAVLSNTTGLHELTLTMAQPLGIMAGLSCLEKLSLYGIGWDLSSLRSSTLRSLVVPDCDTAALAVLDGLNSLRSLQISDAHVTELSPLSDLPGLETLLILVDAAQPSGVQFSTLLTATDAETLTLLETTLPKDQLTAFLDHGGTVLLLPDYNR